MPSIRWNSFFVSSSVAKTVVHFMPVSRSASAPYPVTAKFEVFGVGFPKRAIIIEGARLQQADGIILGDVIPELKNGFTGMLGFSLELSVTQSHAELSDSRCYVELNIASDLVRFEPAVIKDKKRSSELIFSDTQSSYSIIAVNSGLELLPINILGENNKKISLLPSIGVEDKIELDTSRASPWSVVEFLISESETKSGEQELRCKRVKFGYISAELANELSIFLVCRDRQTKKILNVRAL
jgi:hypothetical protein